MNLDIFRVPHDTPVRLSQYDTSYTGEFHTKKDVEKKLRKDIKRLSALQDVLYAHDRYALLLIFQAMDAAGKDSTIKHVMSGINPQGCQVFSFKAPSDEELDHDYLWRCMRRLPERGRIGIFNRSYYEEVLVARVHPEILEKQKLPASLVDDHIWKRRFREINHFEEYLVNNGIVVLKFFLNVSHEEQKKRFLDRIDRPQKNWKFSSNDVRERDHWDEYQHAYEETFSHTSTKNAPWYVIPADRKWFARGVVSEIIVRTLESLDMHYPIVSEDHRVGLEGARAQLMDEPHK